MDYTSKIKHWDDIHVGDQETFTKTMTQTDMILFPKSFPHKSHHLNGACGNAQGIYPSQGLMAAWAAFIWTRC